MGHGANGYILVMFQITILRKICGERPVLSKWFFSYSCNCCVIRRTSKLNVCLYTNKSLHLDTCVLSCVCKWPGACKRLSVCHKLWETNWSVIRVQHSQTRQAEFSAETHLVPQQRNNWDIRMRVPPVWVVFQHSSYGCLSWWVNALVLLECSLVTNTNPTRWPVMLS